MAYFQTINQEEDGDSASPRPRRGSFEGGKAAARGQTIAPIQRTPMIVHHLTLAHTEQKVTGWKGLISPAFVSTDSFFLTVNSSEKLCSSHWLVRDAGGPGVFVIVASTMST